MVRIDYKLLREMERDLEVAKREDEKLAFKLKKEILKMQVAIMESVDEQVSQRKAVPIWQVIKEVENMPKKKRRATGIDKLDRELVDDDGKSRNEIGGFELGNFIQIAGAKGTGKSTFLLSILTNLSNYEEVCWFDFEMGKVRVVNKLKPFKFDVNNLLHYDGSRDLQSIIDQIKVLYHGGVRHFVIDSTMKIQTEERDQFKGVTIISRALSELTSTLQINIYLINQMSQEAEHNQLLKLKNGNDSEYDADFIFYIMKVKQMDGLKPAKDSFGIQLYDESKRVIICEKNRQDERLFRVEILKEDLLPRQEVIEYIYQPQVESVNI